MVTLDSFGRSNLHYAAHDGDVAAVSRLLALGHDVNLPDKQGWTPLYFAAQSQATEVGRLLIESGALIDPKDSHGNTPLGRAVFNSRGNGAFIQLLRQHGANPYSENNSGQSPLGLARLIANYDVKQYFADLK